MKFEPYDDGAERAQMLILHTVTRAEMAHALADWLGSTEVLETMPEEMPKKDVEATIRKAFYVDGVGVLDTDVSEDWLEWARRQVARCWP